jgi:hypothetical protein
VSISVCLCGFRDIQQFDQSFELGVNLVEDGDPVEQVSFGPVKALFCRCNEQIEELMIGGGS